MEDFYLSALGNKTPIFPLRIQSFLGLSSCGLCGNDPTLALGWIHDPALVSQNPHGSVKTHAPDGFRDMLVTQGGQWQPRIFARNYKKDSTFHWDARRADVSLDLQQLSLPQLGSVNEDKRKENRDQKRRRIMENTVWDSESTVHETSPIHWLLSGSQ